MRYQLMTPRIPLKEDYQLNAVEQVLANRGISPQDLYHYLHTTDDDILSPRIIDNIQDGAKMLISHIANNDKIFIQVDSDCDGMTSSALLLNYLNYLFPAFVANNIVYRLHDGKQHGVILNTVPADVKMVIIPDAGSNQYSEHEALANNGVDVLIIDHHEADHVSEYACTINNQLCDYPDKNLSGVGMVYKFCSYLDEIMNTDYASFFVDLVAIGCIGDMMDLRNFELKRLIDLGISHIQNPFFKQLVENNAFSLKDGVTPFGIAFYIVPYVNATIRMGTKEEKELLFKAMLHSQCFQKIPSTKRGHKGEMETIVEQACRNCNNIKNRQTKARDNELSVIEDLIVSQNLLDNKILTILLSPDSKANRNLTGLIANQLMAEYQRPVLLLNQINHEDGSITFDGSARAPGNTSIENWREWMLNTGLPEFCEGQVHGL